MDSDTISVKVMHCTGTVKLKLKLTCLMCSHMTVRLTNYVTTWSTVYLEKLRVPWVVKKFPTFYGTWRLITMFTTTHHLSIYYSRWMKSTPSHPITVRIHLFLCLPSGHFPSCPLPPPPLAKFLYVFLFSPIHEAYPPTPSHSPLLDHLNKQTP